MNTQDHYNKVTTEFLDQITGMDTQQLIVQTVTTGKILLAVAADREVDPMVLASILLGMIKLEKELAGRPGTYRAYFTKDRREAQLMLNMLRDQLTRFQMVMADIAEEMDL